MKKKYGFFLALSAAILWGFSGNIAEYIFKYSNLDVIAYTAFRMLLTGIILIIYGIYINGKKTLINGLLDFKTLKKLIIYGILGIAALQLSFAKTIELSNAPFTTLIQFLAPILILFYFSIIYKKFPKKIEVICTSLALFGMFLMITAANLNTLKVSKTALALGIFSAFTFAFYIIYSNKLFHLPTTFIVGSGMIFGSLILLPFADYSSLVELKKLDILLVFSFNILFGNVMPFYLFSESSRYISPKITSLIGAFEPLTALIVGIVFMNTEFQLVQILGAIILVFSVTFMSIISE